MSGVRPDDPLPANLCARCSSITAAAFSGSDPSSIICSTSASKHFSITRMRAPASRSAPASDRSVVTLGARFIMRTLSTATPKIAKVAGVVSFPKKETSFPALLAVISTINALWPKKTSAHVKHFIEKLLGSGQGPSERTVRFWLASETRMSVEALIALLRTEEGYQILEAVMGDSREPWWLAAKAAQDIRRSRKAIKREQERITQTRAQLDLLDQ